MTKLRTLLALLALVAVLAAGCGSDGDDQGGDAEAPTGTEDTVADTPVDPGSTETLPTMPATAPVGEVDADGVLRMAWAIVPATLDPHQVRENSQVGLFYDTLFVVDGRRHVYQGLATGYVAEPDGSALTITLRDDATFADGTPVDAAAVKASLDRGRTLETSTVKAFLASIDDVEVIDDVTVRLALTQLDTTLIYSLGNAAGSIINPAALASDLSKVPAGSTPYDLVDFEPTRKVVAERRDGAAYWDPNAFLVHRVEVNAVNDANAAVNGLRSGTFELARINLTTAETKRRVGDDFEYQITKGDAPNVVYLRERGALADAAVRQAIGQAIDRKIIAERVIDRCDYAPQLAREGQLGFVPDYDPYRFDPEAAKAVLEGKGIRIQAAVGNFGDYPLIAQVMKQQLADVGVELQIDLLAPTEAIGQYFAGQKDALVLAYGAQADITMSVANEYLGAAKQAGAAADTLAAELATANSLPLGSDERAEAVGTALRSAMELHTIIPVCHINPIYVTTREVKGLSVMTNAWSGLFHARPVVLTK